MVSNQEFVRKIFDDTFRRVKSRADTLSGLQDERFHSLGVEGLLKCLMLSDPTIGPQVMKCSGKGPDLKFSNGGDPVYIELKGGSDCAPGYIRRWIDDHRNYAGKAWVLSLKGIGRYQRQAETLKAMSYKSKDIKDPSGGKWLLSLVAVGPKY